MNRIKNILLLILITISTFFFFTNNTYAVDLISSQHKIIIEDNAELLTEEEETKLKEVMQPLIEYGNIAFKSINENDKTTKEYVENYYKETFQEESGSVFLIDLANKEMYIYSAGESYQTITESVATRILDEVVPIAQKSEYYSCSEKVYQLMLSNYQKNSINESNNQYSLIIEDDASLLTAEEQIKLKDKMQSLTKYGNIIFKSINSNSTTTSVYAREYYHSKFGSESGTIFLIDMYNRQIFINSAGSNYAIITKGKSEIITDNIYQYASNKEYFKCAYNAFDQIETLLEGGKILEPMRYISNIVVSLVSAFFLTFLFVLNQSKIKKASNKDILGKCDVDFNVKDIYGRKTGTRRQYSPVDTSSSGGSSGGGSFGGGSSGGGSSGGGGHSF